MGGACDGARFESGARDRDHGRGRVSPIDSSRRSLGDLLVVPPLAADRYYWIVAGVLSSASRRPTTARLPPS
ncbi:hypothetical protein [Halopiger xanaduensis]|uniref:hypothetical protein n=1 Tax=Halopiger xanaduensis TaxID=387343 RepID=UPI000678111D|nr:hypothetical protein [Halopiger xanaduensis]